MDDTEAEAFRERQIAALRDAYDKIVSKEIADPLGGHFLTFLSALILLFDTRWDEQVRRNQAERMRLQQPRSAAHAGG